MLWSRCTESRKKCNSWKHILYTRWFPQDDAHKNVGFDGLFLRKKKKKRERAFQAFQNPYSGLKLANVYLILITFALMNNEPSTVRSACIRNRRTNQLPVWTRNPSESRPICVMQPQHFYWPKSKLCCWELVKIDRTLTYSSIDTSCPESTFKLTVFAFRLRQSLFKARAVRVYTYNNSTNVSIGHIMDKMSPWTPLYLYTYHGGNMSILYIVPLLSSLSNMLHLSTE